MSVNALEDFRERNEWHPLFRRGKMMMRLSRTIDVWPGNGVS